MHAYGFVVHVCKVCNHLTRGFHEIASYHSLIMCVFGFINPDFSKGYVVAQVDKLLVYVSAFKVLSSISLFFNISSTLIFHSMHRIYLLLYATCMLKANTIFNGSSHLKYRSE